MFDKSVTDQNSISVNASNLNLAVVKAAGLLGVPSNDVGYTVVREGKKGFFNIFKKDDIEIKAWVKSSVELAASEKQEKSANLSKTLNRSNARLSEVQKKPTLLFTKTDESASPEIDAHTLSALIEELKEYTAQLCGFILHTPVSVDAALEDGRLVLNILNDEFNDIMQKNIKLAEALEHLIRKKPRHLRQELPFRVFIDIGGLRKKREQELIGIAAELSLKVAENKKPIVLNYRSAYDRKIIHMALDQNDKVFTKSIGSGSNRKLMILPIKEEHVH